MKISHRSALWKLLLILGLISSAIPLRAQQSPLIIYFDKNTSSLSPTAKAQLDSLSLILSQPNLYEFHAEAHTDTSGNADYNQKLSERRLNAVKKYLQSRAFQFSKAQWNAVGEKESVNDLSTEALRNANRCVMIFWSFLRHPSGAI